MIIYHQALMHAYAALVASEKMRSSGDFSSSVRLANGVPLLNVLGWSNPWKKHPNQPNRTWIVLMTSLARRIINIYPLRVYQVNDDNNFRFLIIQKYFKILVPVPTVLFCSLFLSKWWYLCACNHSVLIQSNFASRKHRYFIVFSDK